MASFTKKAIRESFMRLLAERPVDKITVKDIVEDCGIARNTFYYHYRDIYEVLEEILDMRVQEVIQQMQAGYTGSREQAQQAYMASFAELREQGDILYHIFQSAGEDEVRRYLGKTFTTIFEQLIEIEAEGIPASSEDKRLIARLLRNATTGFLVEWLESGMKLPIEQTVRRLDFLFTDLVREALKRSAADTSTE